MDETKLAQRTDGTTVQRDPVPVDDDLARGYRGLMRFDQIQETVPRVVQATNADCVYAAASMALHSAAGVSGDTLHRLVYRNALPCGTEFEPAATVLAARTGVACFPTRGADLRSLVEDNFDRFAIVLGIDPSVVYETGPSRHAVFVRSVDVPRIPQEFRGLPRDVAVGTFVPPITITDPHPWMRPDHEWLFEDLELAYVRAGRCALLVRRGG